MDDKSGDKYLIKLSLIALVILVLVLPGTIKLMFKESDYSKKENQPLETSVHAYSSDYSSYDDGYTDGYREGLSDAGSECDHDVNEIASIIHEAASSYAYGYTKLGIYDAWDIITVYLDGHDPSGYPLPTKKEFEEAVDTLMLYSMFFDLNYGDFDSIIRDYDPFY